VATALGRLERAGAPVVAYLACTHYGYRQELFAAAFEGAGVRAKVVDPNEHAVDDLFPGRSGAGAAEHDLNVEVEFVTRYAIPEATVETLTYFLSGISPRTVAAMQNFVHLPDLF
jgi:hypothetical protein